jgi:hypothetical protein
VDLRFSIRTVCSQKRALALRQRIDTPTAGNLQRLPNDKGLHLDIKMPSVHPGDALRLCAGTASLARGRQIRIERQVSPVKRPPIKKPRGPFRIARFFHQPPV